MNGTDPQLSGISLAYQHVVIGEIAGKQRFISANATALADGRHGVYLAQQVSSWAPIMFPHPWRAFVAWHARMNASAGASPCMPGASRFSVLEQIIWIPCSITLLIRSPFMLNFIYPQMLLGLFSNHWHVHYGNTVWTMWWNRWAAEFGAFFMYPHESMHVTLAVNHQEVGEHYPKGGKASHAIRTSADTRDNPRRLPPLSSMPLYDLHMRPLRGWHGALAQRKDVIDHLDGKCTWLDMPRQ